MEEGLEIHQQPEQRSQGPKSPFSGNLTKIIIVTLSFVVVTVIVVVLFWDEFISRNDGSPQVRRPVTPLANRPNSTKSTQSGADDWKARMTQASGPHLLQAPKHAQRFQEILSSKKWLILAVATFALLIMAAAVIGGIFYNQHMQQDAAESAEKGTHDAKIDQADLAEQVRSLTDALLAQQQQENQTRFSVLTGLFVLFFLLVLIGFAIMGNFLRRVQRTLPSFLNPSIF
jgi:hypothetical protein